MKRNAKWAAAMAVVWSMAAQGALFVETFHGVDPLFETNHASFLAHVITPAKAALDPADTAVPELMYLVDWTYAKTSSGYGGEAQETAYLGVLSWDGDLNNSSIVGVSTNFVNMVETSTVYPDSLMTWVFDHVALQRDTQYALAWLGPVEGDGGWELIGGGVELEVSDEYPWGGVVQLGNTGMNQPRWNPHFVATYDTVPEPATLSMLVLGGFFLRRRRV